MAILFSDNFNRADGALGANWTSEGGGTIAIVSNEVTSSAAPNLPPAVRYVSAISAVADMSVQCRMKRSASQDYQVGIIARRTAVDTFYWLQLQSDLANVRLLKNVDGSLTALGDVNVADETNYHIFRLDVFGNQINVYRDDVLIIGPITDNAITGAGFGGIAGRIFAGAGNAQWDDFQIADSLPVDSDHVIPLQLKYTLNADLLIPLQFRYRLDADSVIPVEWDISGLIRSDHAIPLQFRYRLNADSVIPISIQLPGGITVDFVIPIQMRRQLNADQVIPILWKLFTDWVAQGASQGDAWTQQASSQIDDWIKQGAGEADNWTKV